MESISPSELAVELLNHCLRGGQWPEELLDALTDEALDEDEATALGASRALFAIVVERLADLFEPKLCDVYARLFARVIERAKPELRARDLVSRYEAVRRVRAVSFEPKTVYVLSRVTLGADVAVTSVVLDGARRRFPKARIVFVATKKPWEMFEKSPRLEHLPVEYGRRGLLRERLAVFDPLRAAFADDESIVLDPDSRLTQLGLLPVCDEERHFLFEARSYGGDGTETIGALTKRWVAETLGVEDAEPWLHPKFEFSLGSQPLLTANFGTGENPAKRVEDPFEEGVLRLMTELGPLVMVDVGAPGSEEETRVRRVMEAVGTERVAAHEGPFASFAAMIAASQGYFGYDSAGQHVAAALGVPLASVFAGYASERMLARWSPEGPGAKRVLAAQDRPVDELLDEVRDAFKEMFR